MAPAARILIAGFLTLLIIAAHPGAAQGPGKLPVVASFSILADLAHNVGGARISVEALVGPDGDAHIYQPAPADAERLKTARLIIVNGLGFEGWIDRLITASGAKAPVIVATEGIKSREMEEGGRIGEDPHAWQSVANAKIYVANIRDGLIAADPEGKETYRANAQAYLAKLDALESEIRGDIARIAPERRRIITTHDAFGYFAADFGVGFAAPTGVSTETEPSARDVARIIRQIRSEKAPAVFLENISDPRASRRIARESGAKIGGALYSDALSPPGGPAPTYIEMMRHNMKELSAALAN